ncbi:MAG: hypothetical protein NTX66_01675 [Candidatus Falkowbacteria bacterium]|nr:hypothetical protein [Candidatus Falkowbacteria bacterium]
MNFFARYKKIFQILIFLVLVVILGWLLWRTFFATTINLSPSPNATSTLGNLPSAGTGQGNIINTTTGELLPGAANQNGGPEGGANNLAVGGLTKTSSLNSNPSLGPTLAADGTSVQYYNQNDGKFYKIDSSGSPVALSDKVFHDVQNVTWAPDKNKAILVYPDGSKIFYDFSQKRQVTIPKHWEDFSFSPDSTRLVSKSIGLDIENRYLIVSSDDGTKAQALEEIGNNGDKVYSSWSPNGQSVAMFTRGLDFDRQEVFFVGLNGENFKSTIIEGRGFASTWSPTGDRLLYSVYSSSNNMNPSLWLVNAQGEAIGSGRTDLGLNTWSSKCTFAGNDKVYCAVPEDLPQGAGLFPELADQTKDDLYAIDLKTGQKKLIAVPDGSYNISQIMVSNNQKNLYFTDKKNQQLYKVNLS